MLNPDTNGPVWRQPASGATSVTPEPNPLSADEIIENDQTSAYQAASVIQVMAVVATVLGLFGIFAAFSEGEPLVGFVLIVGLLSSVMTLLFMSYTLKLLTAISFGLHRQRTDRQP